MSLSSSRVCSHSERVSCLYTRHTGTLGIASHSHAQIRALSCAHPPAVALPSLSTAHLRPLSALRAVALGVIVRQVARG